MPYWHQSCQLICVDFKLRTKKKVQALFHLNSIHYLLRLDHNTPCLSPKFYITIVLKSFLINLERLKTFLMQNIEG